MRRQRDPNSRNPKTRTLGSSPLIPRGRSPSSAVCWPCVRRSAGRENHAVPAQVPRSRRPRSPTSNDFPVRRFSNSFPSCTWEREKYLQPSAYSHARSGHGGSGSRRRRRFCTASRRRYSIWALRLRRSSAAHRLSSSASSDGKRNRKGFRSATSGGPLLVQGACVDHGARGFVRA